jgi:hypothetical protein
MSGTAASFFDLSLTLQIALGSGYLAYATAYAGLRKDHNAGDQLSISLVFSAIGLVIANSAVSLSSGWRVVLTLGLLLLLGIVWRVAGRPIWHWILKSAKIHREDGVYSGWTALVQTNKGVSQATVYTRSGQEFHLADRDPYSSLEWKGLYLCGDGSITMIVDSETDKDGKDFPRNAIVDENWGTRYTHFPAGEILRVELRMK